MNNSLLYMGQHRWQQKAMEARRTLNVVRIRTIAVRIRTDSYQKSLFFTF